MTKDNNQIFLVNEYEEFSDLDIIYMRSIVFTSESDARKFIRKMKRENTIIGGDLRYELESDFLFQDYNSAIEAEGF